KSAQIREILISESAWEEMTCLFAPSIVVTKRVHAGKNMKLTQNSVIGSSGKGTQGKIVIGNNFYLGSNSCIIGDDLKIGDNVTIGAMTFINKDLPDNCRVYTKKVTEIVSVSV
ncbi:serine acetyltransferase, partial [Enterobacter cloacae]